MRYLAVHGELDESDRIVTMSDCAEYLADRSEDVDAKAIQFSEGLFDMPQKDAMTEISRAFNREYLPKILADADGNVSAASRRAGLDPKTFRRKWSEVGLQWPPVER